MISKRVILYCTNKKRVRVFTDWREVPIVLIDTTGGK